jgi:CRP-like cAMP-binding protein
LDPSAGPDTAARLGMLEQGCAFRRDAGALPQLAQASAFRRYRRGDVLLSAGASAPDVFFVVAGQLAVIVPSPTGEIRLELVQSWELMVLQEMLAGGISPVQVVADLDSDVLAIPAQALVDAMDHHRLVARDISAVAEARRQAISPRNRELRVVA